MIILNNIWYLEEKDNKVHEDNILNQVLLNRGLDTVEKVNNFIEADYNKLKDPYLLTDLKKASQRLIEAVKNNQNILIYGDYDVDGVTSTSLFIRFFQDINYEYFDYYIPNRLSEGYGLRIDSLENIELENIDLLITVDCGITANQEVEFLNQKNIDVIISDHHKLGDSIPNAYAVVDPQREDFEYYKGLAGVGVVFKLLQAVDKILDLNKIQNHLDLVALGTVADIVPLKHDNRIIVKEGLKIMNDTQKVGLIQLLSDLSLSDKEINPGQIGYIVAPPINAIGRMEEPDQGVRLLTTNDKKEAEKISQKLISINRDRQKKEEDIYQDALDMIETIDIQKQKPIVLSSRNWHRGVIGIVASRLVEKYYLPVVLIAVGEDGIGHGSARSISNLDITEGLKYAEDYLEKYGGHAMAAGLSIEEDNIDDFSDKLYEYIHEKLRPKDFIPGIKIDSLLDINKINQKFYKKLELFKPYGIGNPRPKFLLSNIKLKKHYTVGKNNKHLKVNLKNGISGIGFNLGGLNSRIKNKKLDLAVKIYLNNWRGKDEIEVRVEDINIRSDHSYFPIKFTKDKITVYDKRGIEKKVKYIKGLMNYQKNIAVFVNGSKKKEIIKEKLAKDGYQVLTNQWDKFKTNKNNLILFDKVFNTDLKKETHLIMYSVPFSFSELIQIINNFRNSKTFIHLIFNENDLKLNSFLINHNLPDKKLIKKAINEIKNRFNRDSCDKDEIFKLCKQDLDCNEKKAKKILQILGETQLIKVNENKVSFRWGKNTELDLSNSVYYNNIINIKKDYKKLRKQLEDKNLFNFINNLTKLEEENNEF